MRKIAVWHEFGGAIVDYLVPQLPDDEVAAYQNEEAFRIGLRDAEILIAGHFNLDAIKDAPWLRWLQWTNSGIDPLVARQELFAGLTVSNAAGIHAALMADYVMATISYFQWDIPRLQNNQRHRRWEPSYTQALQDRTLCVVGLGAVGSEIARRGTAARMKVVGVSRSRRAVAGEWRAIEELDDVLANADFLVVVLPRTAETLGLLNARRLALLPDRSVLINISRGGIVAEDPLVERLVTGKMRGAAVDVFDREPLPPDHALWSLPNVLLTPHISGNDANYARLVADLFLENYANYRRGEKMRTQVDVLGRHPS
ncbi:D-2-hydroxyacid dehydrogenase [Mesorhizobium sp. M1329]|uniref:D-2-hydroxyacid dehydrogenase n=1 Tax=Mesorhizobium sp. M1329 TaxID=2957083 RepID=UPI003337386B